MRLSKLSYPAAFILLAMLGQSAVAFPDYSATFVCDGICEEGKEAQLALQAVYDVPLANDRQHALYANNHHLHQTYTSRITITNITLRDKVFNTTFFDTPANLVFADKRISKNQMLDADPKTLASTITLPRPSQAATLSFVPCFTILYERELRSYNFFDGDYEASYPVDEIEQCGNEVISAEVHPKQFPACIQPDCSWYEACDPETGCRFSAMKITITVLILVLVIIVAWRFLFYQPRRRFR